MVASGVLRLIWMFTALLGAMLLSITATTGPTTEPLSNAMEHSAASLTVTSRGQRLQSPGAEVDLEAGFADGVQGARQGARSTNQFGSRVHERAISAQAQTSEEPRLQVTSAPHRGKQRRGRRSVREPLNNLSNFAWSPQEKCLGRRDPKERQRLRILCLGDSITYGNGSHTRLARREPGGNYPLMLRVDEGLKSMLCPDTRIEVVNLGWNGCSVQDGKRCYRNTLAYRSAIRRMKTADVVVFILGTNDSKDYNWQSSAAFEEALVQYMEEITDAGHPKLEVILAAPPPVYANPLHFNIASQAPQTTTAFHVRMDRLRNEIRNSVTAVAEDFGITFLDLYSSVLSAIPELDLAGMRMEQGTATVEDAVLVKKYYHDGVHPHSPTHEIVTAAVRDAIIWALNQTNITRASSSDATAMWDEANH